MKVLAFDRNVGVQLVSPPEFTLIPDSAMVLKGNPVFLPDFAAEWVMRLYVAYRICRLGKGITLKFAPRYRDAVTLAARVVPADIERQFSASGVPQGLLGAFDGCLVVGSWMDLPADGGALVVEGGGISCSIDTKLTSVDGAIVELSRYLTLKTGDIVMPVSMPLGVAVKVGDIHRFTLGGEPVLTVRIK